MFKNDLRHWRFSCSYWSNRPWAIPRSNNPTYRFDRFRSDPCRISSESDIFHKKPIGPDPIFVGFLSIGIRSGLYRNSTERDEIRPDPTGSDPSSMTWVAMFIFTFSIRTGLFWSVLDNSSDNLFISASVELI